MRREELQRKKERYAAELQRLEPIMNRIDQSLDAIAAIAPEDKIILVDRYIDKVSWEGTARDANCSIGFCRKRAGIALEKLTLMMFGPDAIPLQPSSVVFFKEEKDILE